MKGARVIVSAVVTLAAWTASSCAPTGFQGPSIVNSVRILASSADQPYATPGSEVNVSVLAFDGRTAKPEPMTIYWIPIPCMNPKNDAYYACFATFAAAMQGDAGAGGGGPGFDLSLLPQGPSLPFRMPADAITGHPPVQGAIAPYGLAILFNIACAGHLELIPLDPNNIQAPPLGCFDAQHHQLGAADYVFGFTRVYSYAEITNANPQIDAVDIDGTQVPIDRGMAPVLTLPRCGTSCASKRVGPVVPPSSQEIDPTMHDAQGKALKESVWAEYFSTIGTLGDDVKLLYDTTAGSVGSLHDTDDEYTPPSDPGTGFIWIVVHDNRGGATWVTVPVTVQ